MGKNSFGNKIAKLRKEKGMTQSELADILKISNKTVSRWETGEGYPEVTLIVPLAESLGVSTDFLLKDEAPIDGTGSKDEACQHFPESGVGTSAQNENSKDSKDSAPSFVKKKRIWRKLTPFNKISFVALMTLIVDFFAMLIFLVVCANWESTVMWYPIIVVAGGMIFQMAPWIGIISAIVGLALGAAGKCEKQIKASIILIILNILLPSLWFLIWFAVS